MTAGDGARFRPQDSGNATCIAMTTAHLELVLPAVPDSIPAIRKSVGDAATELDADVLAVDAVRLAVTEAATNVVRHAYGAEGGEIRIAVERGAGTMTVWVVDGGTGIVDRPRGSEGGYGLRMIRALTRSCEISGGSDGGTTVRMVFALAPGEPVP